MYLSPSEEIQKELLKQTVYDKLCAPKLDALSLQIENFLNNGKDYGEDFDKIGAFSFEFNYYLDFLYVGYPHYLYEDGWTDNVVLDVSSPEDAAIKSELHERFMNNPEIAEDDREQLYFGILRESDCEFFCKAWKKAKEKVGSDKICFVEVHDCGAGYYSNTGLRLSEVEIVAKVRGLMAAGE